MSTAGFTVSTSGFKDLEARMKLLGNDVATKVGQSANRAGAVVIAKAVKAAAPIGPDAEGSTRRRKRKSGKVVEEKHHKISQNVKVRKVKSAAGSVENAVTVGNAYHASFVEFGSIHNAPNPFFRTAFEGSKDAALGQIKKILGRRLDKAGV